MGRLVRVAITRARLTLALWAAAVALLAAAGIGVQDRLVEGNFDLPDTESHAATTLDDRAFGPNDVVTVMLEGPPRALDRQGRALTRRLARRWDVLSPFAGGADARRLRPSRRRALIVVSIPHPDHLSSAEVLKPVDRVIERSVADPVQARTSGFPVVGRALNDAALDAADQAQRIAIPVLVLVLLFVFRSPIAAAIPLTIGLATVSAAAGVMALLAELYSLTAFGVSIAAMMGLALGVDYSLLIVSRFREELAHGRAPREAAEVAALTAGRTVLVAGLALGIAMLVATLLAPGDILVSSATGVLVAVALSVVAGVTAVPAALSLLGARVNRWTIGSGRLDSSLVARVGAMVMRRPRPLVVGIVVALAAVSIPAFGLSTNPPNVQALADDDRTRRDFEATQRAFGPGFIAPFRLTLVADRGRMTEPRRLRAIARFEREVGRDPFVTGVVGPGGLAARRERGPLSRMERAAAGFTLNLDRGSDAARILVLPRQLSTEDASTPFRDRLAGRLDRLERQTGTEAATGGPAAEFVDYKREFSDYMPTLILTLAFVTYLLLIPVLRSLLLPLLAVVLNLLTVGAAFGAIALLFASDPPPLGGPGYVDAVSLAGIFTVLFALSVDYEIFLLSRIREGYQITGETRAAILHGIGRTGRVITGAATAMIAVFLAFATSGFISIRQLGVGLAIAVTLDAMVLRLVLLPAAMDLLGRWNWWLPAWLGRRLPDIPVESREAAPSAGYAGMASSSPM